MSRLLLVYEVAGQRFEHPISQGMAPVTLGRQRASVDVHVPHDSVSRRHARISWPGRLPMLEDIGSANGTVVSGLPVKRPMSFYESDIIALGDVEIWVREG